MINKKEQELVISRCQVQDKFWSYYQDLVKDVVIPYQEKILNDEIEGIEKSHAIENFRIAAGESTGEFYGMVFQDSDVAKWLEAVAYSLEIEKNSELEKRADEIIDLIGRAQQEDGYLNTYFTVKEPEHRWQNLMECHELYCAGHMIEAGVAYYESTGKDKLLKIVSKFADHIDSRFGVDKLRGIPGHEEIELALLRLYRVTGEERYLKLSQYFIDERGTSPNFFVEELKNRDWKHWGMNPENPKYFQSHAVVRDQDKAEGHSVRAMYLYTAMADLAGEIKDKSLYKACLRLWENTVQKRMYVTGGIGSTVNGEAFTIDYDLPNDTVYAETCGGIGLIFFARKMLQLNPSGEFADVMERALYNGVLSGMQHDGKRFFYVNPLEVVPGVSGVLHGYEHVLPKRPEWYQCACCPPNVARLLTSLPKYAWGESGDTIYSHIFLGGMIETLVGGGLSIQVQSQYPWKGIVSYTIEPTLEVAQCTLAIRIPGWCKDASVKINGQDISLEGIIEDGYIYLKRTWKSNDTVTLNMDMPVRRIYANTAVRDNAGCVALTRGPIVYCLEEEDNGPLLYTLRITKDEKITAVDANEPTMGTYTALEFNGVRMKSDDKLYSDGPPASIPVKLRAIPYYLWGNRSAGEMRVWIMERA